MRLTTGICVFGLFSGVVSTTIVGGEETGILDKRILFGQSAAFTGPAQELGKNMRLGIQAAFHEINKKGGVHGRKLELVSLDDAYEPETAIINTRHLIDRDQVFALIGAVGTPTSRSAVPIAMDAGVPYIAPFTGAAFLRQASLSNVINLRASYDQETETMISYLVNNLGIERVAVIYQDDSFGRAGYRGVQRALKQRDMEPVAIGVYPRNTTVVKTALLDVRDDNPGGVIIIGAYKPVAALIAWARHTNFDPVFITISFVGSNALVRELGTGGAGVLVTQVVPLPEGEKPAVVSTYRKALSTLAVDTAPSFVSLEGYLAGRLAIVALERCGPAVNRTCFLDTLRQTDNIDLDGFMLRYGDNDNQGSDTVFLTTIGSDGNYHSVETLGSLMRSCASC